MNGSAEPRAVLVTGTSTGIGHATATLLDKSGYQVFAGVRKQADVDRLRREGSDRLCPLILDVTKPDQIDAAVDQVRQTLGPNRGLHCVVNNAGIVEAGPIELMSLDRVRWQFEVNVVGPIAITQAFLPFIRQGKGRVISVASSIAYCPVPYMGVYAASKCAVQGINEALRRELRWFDIPVTIVNAGLVASAIWNSAPQSLAVIADEDPQHLYDKKTEMMQVMMEDALRDAVPPERVAAVIKKAVDARWPKPRYHVGPGSRMAILSSRTPPALMDWILETVATWQSSRKLKKKAAERPSAVS